MWGWGRSHSVELNVSLFFFSHWEILPLMFSDQPLERLILLMWRLSCCLYLIGDFPQISAVRGVMKACPRYFIFMYALRYACDTQVKSQVVGCVPGWHCLTRTICLEKTALLFQLFAVMLTVPSVILTVGIQSEKRNDRGWMNYLYLLLK